MPVEAGGRGHCFGVPDEGTDNESSTEPTGLWGRVSKGIPAPSVVGGGGRNEESKSWWMRLFLRRFLGWNCGGCRSSRHQEDPASHPWEWLLRGASEGRDGD